MIADLGLRPEAQKLVDEYPGKDGKPRCIFAKTDVIQWPDLDNMFAVADKELGGADIVRCLSDVEQCLRNVLMRSRPGMPGSRSL